MKCYCRLFACLMCCLSVSCNEPDDIAYVADSSGSSSKQVSIAYLRSLYQRAPVLIEEEIYIIGTLVSSDQFDVFYKTMIINDKTGGIALRVNMENYHRKYYELGNFKINCKSLTINSYGGQLQLAIAGNEISTEEMPMVITHDEYDKEFIPLPLTIDIIKPAYIQRLVCFDDVQFETYGPWYDGDEERYIVDRAGNRLNVRTPRYAKFADSMLPTGSGYIEGILTVFNGVYQLEMVDNRMEFMDNERFVVGAQSM